jgi:hypothetical protein
MTIFTDDEMKSMLQNFRPPDACLPLVPAHGSALADVALIVMREHGRTCVWYGDPQLCQDIYTRWGGKHTHPLNTIATVIASLARSKKWRRDGYISHIGRRYPVYTPNTEASNLHHD